MKSQRGRRCIKDQLLYAVGPSKKKLLQMLQVLPPNGSKIVLVFLFLNLKKKW